MRAPLTDAPPPHGSPPGTSVGSMRSPVLRSIGTVMPVTTSRRARSIAPLAALAIFIAACGGAPPSLAPTAVPTPVPTPNVHLGDSATAGDVYTGLGRAGLRITPNSASTFDDPAAPIIKRITATYLDWPLDVFEFRTTKDLNDAVKAWKSGDGPGRGDPPISIIGLNILVTWGPRMTGRVPEPPNTRQADALEALVDALEPLLSPLRARAVVPIELASVPVVPAPTTSAGPSAAPKATPAP